MYRIIKRILSILCSVISIIVLSPLFIIISLVVKISSKGSVFFIHERIGFQGKKFKLIKFRTMVDNAEDMIAAFTPEQK